MNYDELLEMVTNDNFNFDLHNFIKFSEIYFDFRHSYNRKYECLKKIKSFLWHIDPINTHSYYNDFSVDLGNLKEQILNYIFLLGTQKKKNNLRKDILIDKDSFLKLFYEYKEIENVIKDFDINKFEYFKKFMKYEYAFTKERIIFEADGKIFNLYFSEYDNKFHGKVFEMRDIKDDILKNISTYSFQNGMFIKNDNGIFEEYLREFYPENFI